MKNALEDQKIDATSAGRFNFSGKKLSEYTVTNATAKSESTNAKTKSSSSKSSTTSNLGKKKNKKNNCTPLKSIPGNYDSVISKPIYSSFSNTTGRKNNSNPEHVANSKIKPLSLAKNKPESKNPTTGNVFCSAKSATNSASEPEPFPLQLMVYVSDDDIKNCKKMDKNIGLAMAGSARAVCDTAKAKKSKSSTSITNSSTAATTSVPTSSASSPDAAEKITGLAITGKDGLVSDIKDKFTKFLDAVITNLPDESILDDTQLKDVKSSLEHLVDFFVEEKSIGSFRGFNSIKATPKDKLEELKGYLKKNSNSLFPTTFARGVLNSENKTKSAPKTICPLTVEFRAIQILSRINDVAQELEKVSKKLETDSNSSNSSSSQSSSSSLSSSSNSSNSKDAVNKMLDAIKDIADLGIGKQLEAVKELRNNEMFYEFPLDKFDDNLVDAMVGALPGTITAPQKENIKELAKFALQQARFADIGEEEETMCCGVRGRMKMPNFGEEFANRIAKSNTDSSNSSNSSKPLLYNYVGQTFVSSVDANFNLEVENKLTNNSVMRQLRSDRAFCNNKVERPIQFACDGMLLDSRVSIINDPVGFLKLCVDNKNVNAYNEVNKTGNSESALNTSDAQLKNPPNLDNLSDANKASIQQTILAAALPTGTCETDTYKTVKDLLNETTQSDTTNSRNTNTSSPKVYESRPNLASAMKDHHLRTLCSVSGTTTDIVAALCGMGNETRVKNALQSLSDAVTQNNNSDSNNNNNANTPIPLNAISIPNMLTVDPTKLTPEFKNLFLSIAMYMQSGQYHSAASVLCGLYCAAMSLGAVVETVVHIASYSALLEAFATSPAAFFPPVAV